jgi:hypothetical protein
MAEIGMFGVPSTLGQLTPGAGGFGGYGIAGQPFGLQTPYTGLPWQNPFAGASVASPFGQQAAQVPQYALHLLQAIPQQIQQLQYLQQFTAQQIQLLCQVVPQQLQQLRQLTHVVTQQIYQLQQQLGQQSLGIQPTNAAFGISQAVPPWAWSTGAPGLIPTQSATGFSPTIGQVM